MDNLTINNFIKSINIDNLPKYEKDGIFPTEILSFIAMCKKLDINLIIESGIKYGYSTSMLNKYYTSDIISIDILLFNQTKERFKNTNVKLIEGDSSKIIQDIVNDNKNKNIACLIDGPKGQFAINICNNILKNNNVLLCGIHDVSSDFDEDRISLLNNSFYDYSFFITSEEKEHYNNIKYIDKKYVQCIDNKIYQRFKYGPGLFIILNK